MSVTTTNEPASTSRPAHMRHSWLQTVLLSVAVSLLVQYGLPWLESNNSLKSSICDNRSIPQCFKFLVNCNNPSLRRERIPDETARELEKVEVQKAQVTYFHDPFPLEPWSEDSAPQYKDGELMLKAPQSISKLGSRPEPWTEAEAVAALQAARRSRASGNFKRAESIIEHAFALAPNSPEVLYEYGVFIETVRKNIVEAEGFYRKALTIDPSHSAALVRRAKALPLVEDIDNRMLREINRKRDIFLQIPWNNPGLKRAMRDSYFQHVYHTVALEGNTMSLVQTRVLLETRMAVAGKSIIEHNEILGMDAALRFLNQTLAHVGKLTIQDVLAIHKRVLGFVDPMAAGMLRSTQVYVGSFTPTAPEYVMEEMAEMIEWLNDDETLQLDPVELAALAHYKLVYIHPFIDGNGRTARLLMNFILMQSGFPPVIIPVDDRGRYYTTLQAANEGDLRPFIRFIAELTDKALESFITSSSVCDVHECQASDSEVAAERIIY